MAGRPTEYDPEKHPALAKQLAEQGAIDTQIAEQIGIHVSTLYAWKHRFPEFSDALSSGKAIIDDMVEAALFRRAAGMIQVKEVTNSDDGYKEVIKELPPDPTSMIFWLKNRRPEKWREKQEVESNERSQLNIRVQNSTDDSNVELHINGK
jgi:hypothetical protein